MALHTLGCRIGLSVCATEDMLELAARLASLLLNPLLSPDTAALENIAVACAAWAVQGLLVWEVPPKCLPDVRPPLEKLASASMRLMLNIAGKADKEHIAGTVTCMVDAGALADDSCGLSCGAAYVLFNLLYSHPSTSMSADAAGLFSAALDLFDRVIPAPLPAEWWIATCAEVDVTSVRQLPLWILFVRARYIASMVTRPWWPRLRELSIAAVKLNAAAGLSARP